MNNTKLNITTELNTIDGSIVNPNKEEFFIESPFEQDLLEFRNKSYEYSLKSASARITKEKNKLAESNRVFNFY